MRATPEEWALSFVAMFRTTQRRCACFAHCGISSEKCVPGTLVLMVRNGPPNSVFGFGSQLSS